MSAFYFHSFLLLGAGKCFVVTEEVSSSKEIVQIHFAAKDLDKKDVFGKSDPFMTISRTSPMHSGNNFPSFPPKNVNIIPECCKKQQEIVNDLK